MPFYELTGWGPIVASLLLLAVVAGVAVVVLPRRRGPGVRKHVEQALGLVLVSVLTVAALFFKLNADNVWYASWADLVGEPALATAAVDSVAGTPPDQAGRARSVSDGRFSELQRDPRSNPDFGAQVDTSARDGQWVTFRFTGPTTGITQKLLVWLPPSYLSHPDQTYPVITAFSGYPGSPDSYLHAVHYDQIVRDQVNARKLREPIVVIPDVFPAGQDSECVDGSGGNYESYVAVDVVNWIRKNLRATQDAEGWATTGYSAGGWCATMLSVRHPQQWPYSINLAGYFAPQYSSGQQWTAPGDPRYDLAVIADQHKPAVSIWFFDGGQDPGPRQAAAAFGHRISAPTSMVSTIAPSGGHRLTVWQPAMADSLAWLGTTSSGFAATK